MIQRKRNAKVTLPFRPKVGIFWMSLKFGRGGTMHLKMNLVPTGAREGDMGD